MKIEANDKVKAIGGYAFDELNEIKNKLIKKGVDIIDFGIGDPTIPTPEFIRESAKKAIDGHKCSGYPLTLGSAKYLDAICKYTKKRFNVALNPKTQILSNLGSKESIFNFPLAFLNPGDVVLCPNPGYPPYERGTIFAGGKVHFMNLTKENNFYPDFGKIPATVLKKAKIMWINYPNNPTSQMATKEFYKKAVAFCHKNNIILASDEPYSEIYFDEPSISLLEIETEGVVVFNSFSKRSAMTGYRIGWAAGDEKIISAFKKLKANIDSGTPNFIQEAAITALGDEDHVKTMRKEYQKKRDILINAFYKIGLETNIPKATFYLWQKTKNKTGAEFAKQLLEECGILVSPGEIFAVSNDGINPGNDYVRVALVPSIEKTKEAAKRIINAKIW
ncbi:MAG: aminotransferase class I/II-fold pyridoxal phosphate-dependent enzyme [Candidatus Aenigmarchaeota archaeon]|nr:aminotransferase class I/II-fold pyridoxal phosphate-dependent enzyme [Candidatus Aenigmarchaeota archaeon]